MLTREPVSEASSRSACSACSTTSTPSRRAPCSGSRSRRCTTSCAPGRGARPSAAASDRIAAAGRGGPAPRPARDAALVELSSVLGELAEAVRDLRRETDAERRERVDDLAVLIDLITTGWQGLDARLGRIERQVSRLDAGAPRRDVARPAAPPPAARAEPASPLRPEEARRSRLPFVAALTLVGALIVTLAVLQLASGGPDVAGSSPRARDVTPTTRPAQGELDDRGCDDARRDDARRRIDRVAPAGDRSPATTSSVATRRSARRRRAQASDPRRRRLPRRGRRRRPGPGRLQADAQLGVGAGAGRRLLRASSSRAAARPSTGRRRQSRA